jgi:uncharacterized protein (TIGR00661 family)
VKIHYGIQSQGQGHIVRAAAMISRLRARGHAVAPFLVGQPPPSYARGLLGPYEFHPWRAFHIKDGRLDMRATAAAIATQVPGALKLRRELGDRLVRDRVDLVLTDLEPISAWAAWRVGIPSAGISGQYRISRTDAPGPGKQRTVGRMTIDIITPGLSRYFAVSFFAAKPTRAKTQVVAPIIDEGLRAMPARSDGFVLAYLYTYKLEQVLAALQGPTRFRVYGMDRDERIGDVDFRPTDRQAFLSDLAACDGAILNGSFQGVCEAIALRKPVLSIPFAQQYEEAFNAFNIERCGHGIAAASLDAEAVQRFEAFRRGYRPPPLDAHALGDGAAQVIGALSL